MEADGIPGHVQTTDDKEPVLSFCPSFNSYSSDKCPQIAADVAKASSDDFEFAFEKAEEISHVDAFGEFRQIFPVFNRHILFADHNRDHPKDEDDEGKRDFSTTLLLPLKQLFDEDPSTSSCSSSEVDEVDRVPEGTYCVWRPKPVESASPETTIRCKKSNSTGSGSKRWKLRDLLLHRRSNSDGKGLSFVFLTPKSITPTRDVKEIEDSKERRNSVEVASGGKGKAKGRAGGGEKASASAHEEFYVRNRASKEVDKRKSYLPYRKDLVGFFASVNGGRAFPAASTPLGAGKALPPF